MKRFVLIVMALYVLILTVSFTNHIESCGKGSSRKSAGAPPYYTGAPGEGTCAASGCHDGGIVNVNEGPGDLTVTVGEANSEIYVPGTEYLVTVKLKENGVQRMGFQIVALDENNQSAGKVFIPNNSERVQLRDKSNVTWGCCQDREWVGHTFEGVTCQDSTSWSYWWLAPNEDVGNITFYVAGLSANSDQTDTLDHTYTNTLSLRRGFEVGIDDNDVNKHIQMLNNYTLSVEGVTEGKGEVEIWSIDGKKVFDGEVQLPRFEINPLRRGIYLIRLTDLYNKNFTSKLIVR